MACLLASPCCLLVSRDAPVDTGHRSDMDWFRRYAREGNGVHLLPPRSGQYMGHRVRLLPHLRRCLHNLPLLRRGEHRSVHGRVPCHPRVGGSINSVEIVVLVNTDNAASAAALSLGHACAREIWLLAALGSFEIEVRHKPCAQFQFMDTLSRPHNSPPALEFVRRECAARFMQRIEVAHPVSPFSSI